MSDDKKNCNLGKYGGQAVIEGVMMMGKTRVSTVIRKLDGDIKIETNPHERVTTKYKFLNIPIIRGVFSFFDSMLVGIKSLMKSADEFDIEEDDKEKQKTLKQATVLEANEEQPKEEINNEQAEVKSLVSIEKEEKKDEGMPQWLLILTLLLSLSLSIGLFILLPSVLANLSKMFIGEGGTADVWISIIEHVARFLIFLGYIFLVSYQSDVKRVFEYHGAEHKTINCFEAGEELTVENVKKQSRFNPRCGTSFLFLVMIVSTIVYSFPAFTVKDNMLITLGTRLMLLPVIAGVSYELVKLLGTNNSKIAKIMNVPGMWFQKFTTKEPDEKQMEIAIIALKEVIE